MKNTVSKYIEVREKERLVCIQQYVYKILRGAENMSLETLTKLEQAMGIQLIID